MKNRGILGIFTEFGNLRVSQAITTVCLYIGAIGSLAKKSPQASAPSNMPIGHLILRE